MAVLCGMSIIQYSARSARLYLIGGSLGPPESSTQTASRSLQPFMQGSRGDRPTDHATRSVTIGGIYARMWSNNNCSICRLLDWFPCFYHRMEQGTRIDNRQRAILARFGPSASPSACPSVCPALLVLSRQSVRRRKPCPLRLASPLFRPQLAGCRLCLPRPPDRPSINVNHAPWPSRQSYYYI